MTVSSRRSGRRVRPLFRIRSLFVCTAILLCAGCSRHRGATTALTVDHEISPQPVRVGPVTLTLKLASAGVPVKGARVGLEADMSHPGMSPGFGEAREIEPGLYRGQLQLGMAGDWVILLDIALPGGEKVERQIDVLGVRPS